MLLVYCVFDVFFVLFLEDICVFCSSFLFVIAILRPRHALPAGFDDKSKTMHKSMNKQKTSKEGKDTKHVKTKRKNRPRVGKEENAKLDFFFFANGCTNDKHRQLRGRSKRSTICQRIQKHLGLKSAKRHKKTTKNIVKPALTQSERSDGHLLGTRTGAIKARTVEEINTSVSILGTIDNVYLRGIWSDAKGPTDENVVQAMTSFRRGL